MNTRKKDPAAIALMLSGPCFLLFLALGTLAIPSEQQIESVNGIRIVHNTKGGVWGVGPKITLDLLRTIGNVDTNDENLAFGSPLDMAVDDGGRVYILDSGDQRIQVFGSDGKYLRTIGRRGQGPGEFERLNSINFDSQGNLHVLDSAQRRIQVFTPRGEVLKTTPIIKLSVDRMRLLWRADRELNYSTKLIEKGRQEVTANSTRYYAPKLNRVTDAVAADEKGRAWIVTRDRQIKKEEEVTIMVSGSVDRGSTRKVVGDTELRTTDMYKLEILAPDGIMLGAIPMTHFVDGIWVHRDRFFLLDRDRGVQFYEYKINEK